MSGYINLFIHMLLTSVVFAAFWAELALLSSDYQKDESLLIESKNVRTNTLFIVHGFVEYVSLLKTFLFLITFLLDPISDVLCG